MVNKIKYSKNLSNLITKKYCPNSKNIKFLNFSHLPDLVPSFPSKSHHKRLQRLPKSKRNELRLERQSKPKFTELKTAKNFPEEDLPK